MMKNEYLHTDMACIDYGQIYSIWSYNAPYMLRYYSFMVLQIDIQGTCIMIIGLISALVGLANQYNQQKYV